MKKLFVWDFHGTLEKGNNFAVLEITNRALKVHGHNREMSEDEAYVLSGKHWWQYFQHLLPELHADECLSLQATCLSISQNNPDIIVKYIKLNTDAMEVLTVIDKSPHSQIVLSNTQPKALDVFLSAVGIEHLFPHPHRIGVATHAHAHKSKKEWLTEYLAANLFDQIVSIGDSSWDIELAQCHPKGIGYLYTYPDRIHKPTPHQHHKITNLRDVLIEL